MSFWDLRYFIDSYDQIAISGPTYECTYGELLSATSRLNIITQVSYKRVVLLIYDSSIQTIYNYLSLLRAGECIILVHKSSTNKHILKLIRKFNPTDVYFPSESLNLLPKKYKKLSNLIYRRKITENDLCLKKDPAIIFQSGRSFRLITYQELKRYSEINDLLNTDLICLCNIQSFIFLNIKLYNQVEIKLSESHHGYDEVSYGTIILDSEILFDKKVRPYMLL